jgi:5-methylcytosine-specific restriction protein A
MGAPIPRIRGRQLQRLRARLFREHPWCVHCLESGLKTRATIRDHIVPLGEGGPDEETNTQALCAACSKVKTEAESARGVRRGWMR